MKKIAEIFVFLKGESKKFTSSRPSHFQAVDFHRLFLYPPLPDIVFLNRCFHLAEKKIDYCRKKSNSA